MLVEYIKDLEGNLIGCVVATGAEQIGWSLYNTKKERVPFNKRLAVKIAEGRALFGTRVKPAVRKEIFSDPQCQDPNWVRRLILSDVVPHQIEKMRDRAKRYFK